MSMRVLSATLATLTVLTVLAAAASGADGEAQQAQVYYHERVGVAEAARLRRREATLTTDVRIVGGSPAGVGAHPHLGGLVITLMTGGTSVCGSSLLSNTRSVTAAHCWWDGRSQARQFVLVHGSAFLFSGGVRTTTSDVLVHDDWNPPDPTNDVAIIRHNFIGYTNAIWNIALPSGSMLNENFAGSWVQAAGFGRIRDGPAGDITLNQFKSHVSLQVITNAVCRQSFVEVVESTLCTSGAGGRGTCGGDSGGPLTINTINGPVLIGITSFGASAGCQVGAPAAFARVTVFESWIRAQI